MRAVLISRTKIVIFVFLINFRTVEILVSKLLLEGQGNHWGGVRSRVGLNFGLQWSTPWWPSLIWNKSFMKIQTIERNPLNAWSGSVKKLDQGPFLNIDCIHKQVTHLFYFIYRLSKIKSMFKVTWSIGLRVIVV